MKTINFLVLLFLATGVFGGQEMDKARELYRSGDFVGAKVVLGEMSPTLEVLHSRALIEVALGNYSRAISLFEEVIEKGEVDGKKLLTVHYELGQIRDLVGDVQGAVLEYKIVLEGSDDEGVREKIREYLSSHREEDGFSYNLSMGGVWGDNIASQTDEDSLIFYGLRFRNDSKPMEDFGLTSSVGVRHRKLISRKFSWESNFNVESLEYVDVHGYNQEYVEFSSGPSFREGRWKFDVPLSFNYAFLGSERYFSDGGVGVNVLRFFRRAIIGLSISTKRRDYYSWEERSGWIYSAGLFGKMKLPLGLIGDVGISFREEDCEESYLSNSFPSLKLGLGRKLFAGISSSAFVVCGEADYEGDQVMFGKVRLDKRLLLGVSFDKKLSKKCSLSLAGIHYDNDSNLDYYRFESNTIMTKVNFNF